MELTNTVVTTRVESAFGAPVHALHADNPASEDNNEVTRDGFLLTEALRTAQQTPDLRADKIASLKARIASGEYEIDVKLLARKLVEEDGALFRF